MSNYKGIKGFQVQTRTEDPTPYAQALADNPYAGSWASGGDLNSSRRLLGASGVSNSSGLVFGGRTPAPAKTGITESYNGTSWTEVADLDQARDYLVGAGTATAALAIGGSTSTSTTAGYTESWNGSAWTEVNALTRGPSSPQSTTYGAASGSNTSALFYASDEVSNANARTESWDGSNWTEVADQNTARSYGVGVGTSNSAALLIGGLGSPSNPGFIANVEEWNGSSWTEIADINTVRIQASGAMQGTTEATIYFGGRTPPATSSALTENWNGTSWTEVADLATARRGSGGSGVATSAFMAGGQTGPSGSVVTTEEWAFSGLDPSTTPAADYADAITGDFYYNSTTGQFKNVNTGGAPVGTWSSGGTLGTGRESWAGTGGTRDATITFGGYIGSGNSTANTETYDGSSWTEVANLNTARSSLGATKNGSQTAIIGIAGGANPGSAVVESWNGSSWTEVADVNTARYYIMGSGTSTAGLAFGGGPNKAETESWNGSSWTEVSDLNTGRGYGASAGTQTAAIAMGGNDNSANRAYTEIWDGSSWTEVSDLNAARYGVGGSGTSTDGLCFGAHPGGTPPGTQTEHWNGTSWTEINDLSTARGYTSGTGATSSAAICLSGTPSSNYQISEEFTAADFQIKSVTTS